MSGLDVVIVSFRSRELLRACLGSLRDHGPAAPMRVTVVDNGSDDGTPEMVESEFPEADLVRSSSNLGFAAATNVGIKRGSAPYVLALNPDTRVLEGSLDRMLAAMEEHPEVGICGCRLQRQDGRLDHAARREFPTVLGAIGHFSGLGRARWSPRALAQYRAPDVEVGKVDAVSGACMMVRRRPLEELGLFDEGYWMYFEDLDLCYRFARAGWTTWYEPSATVIHMKHGSSGRRRTARINIAFHHGMFRFWHRNVAPDRLLPTNLAVYAGVGARLLVSLVRSAVTRRARRK